MIQKTLFPLTLPKVVYLRCTLPGGRRENFHRWCGYTGNRRFIALFWNNPDPHTMTGKKYGWVYLDDGTEESREMIPEQKVFDFYAGVFDSVLRNIDDGCTLTDFITLDPTHVLVFDSKELNLYAMLPETALDWITQQKEF